MPVEILILLFIFSPWLPDVVTVAIPEVGSNVSVLIFNSSPVKYAASLLGMCKPSVRLPLVEVRDETKKKVSEALKVAKLL